MQMVTRLDIIIDKSLLTAVLILKLKDFRFFAISHNLSQKVLDRIAAIVDLWKLKDRDNA